ncbi:hypothetical protein IPH25_03055 [bacterium]|nr:MAG: hypothetical protein IPG37_00045 [bacterium]QQR61445.1 MAG: hypothetical protein IPH25_03055 [bacterium]QQR63029.1 MAG: hypothetical protein IPH67_00955 [bacterium]
MNPNLIQINWFPSVDQNESKNQDSEQMLDELDYQLIERSASMRRVLCLSFIVGIHALDKRVQNGNNFDKFRSLANKHVDINTDQVPLEKLEKKNGKLEQANEILTRKNNVLMENLTNLKQLFKANELALEQAKLNYEINSNKLKKDCEDKLIMIKVVVQWLLKSEYQKKLDEKEQLLTQQRKEIDQLQTTEANLYQVCKKNEPEIQQKQKEPAFPAELIQTQTNKIAEQENTNLKLQKENEKLEKEQKKIKDELLKKQKNVELLTEKKNKIVEEIEQIKQELEKLKAENQKLNTLHSAEMEKIRKELEGKETKKNNVVRRLESLQREKTEMQTLLETEQAKTKEFEKLQQDNEKLGQEKADFEGTKAQFELEKKRLHEQIEAQKKSLEILTVLFVCSQTIKNNEINTLQKQVEALTPEKQAVEKANQQSTDLPPKNLDKPQGDYYINAFLFASLAFGGLLYKHHGSILYYLNHVAVKLSEELRQGLYNLVDI